MPDDLFTDATDQEREMLQMILRRKRIDEGRGRIWCQIWPDVGGTFAMPIPLAVNGRDEPPKQEVIVSDIRVQASEQPRTPAPATRLPQLEHADEEEIENDDPPPNDLTGLDDIILDVLQESSEPIKITTIAKRGKVVYNSYLRQRIRSLASAGKIRKTTENRYAFVTR